MWVQTFMLISFNKALHARDFNDKVWNENPTLFFLFFTYVLYCTTKRVLPLSKWPGEEEEEEEERRSLVRCHGIVVIEGGEGYDLMLRYDRMNFFTYFLPGRIYSKEKGENTEEFHVQK